MKEKEELKLILSDVWLTIDEIRKSRNANSYEFNDDKVSNSLLHAMNSVQDAYKDLSEEVEEERKRMVHEVFNRSTKEVLFEGFKNECITFMSELDENSEVFHHAWLRVKEGF